MTSEEAPDVDLTGQHLDVYASKRGRWNPDHGDVELPAGWEFLPSGDHYVTRRVKAAGTYWTAWRPRSRTSPHRRKLGLYAPTSAIEEARAAAAATDARRAAGRQRGARQRVRVADAARLELAHAVRSWLDFAPEHAALAEAIAEGAAERAAVVGSGRVGRTTLLPLDERAALAARAYIRHRYTRYEERLDELATGEFDEADEPAYRAIKSDAHAAVDAFIAQHRPR